MTNAHLIALVICTGLLLGAAHFYCIACSVGNTLAAHAGGIDTAGASFSQSALRQR